MADIKIADPLLRKITYAIGILIVISLGFYTFGLLKNFIVFVLNVLSPFLASLLLAYILAPIVVRLQKNLKLGRIVGTLLLYIMVFLIVFILLFFLVPKFLEELSRLFEIIKEGIPGFIAWLSENTPFKIDSQFIRELKKQVDNIEIDYQKITTSILPALRKIASGGLSALGDATKGFFSGLGFMASLASFMVFVGIISFYFIVDWEKIRPTIEKMVPPQYRERTFDVLDKIDEAMGGFLRGQLTVAIIVGLMFATGLFFMGFIGFPALRNYAILIGTAAGIAGFIPYLGAIIGLAPAILIVLLTGGVAWSMKLITLAIVLALFSLIQAIEGFVLQPRIVGKSAGLHPLVVLLALIVGSRFGIGGLIIAVPAASVIRVLVKEFYWNRIEQKELDSSHKKTAPQKKAKRLVKYPGLEGKAPWTLEAADIIERLETDPEEGLQQKEAAQRRQYYGANRIKSKKRRSAFRILLDQFKNLIIFLLIAAASVSYAFEQLLEGTAIVVAMLVNVVIGFGTELRAVRSMEALQKMTRVETKILRRGKIRKVPAMDLVPGDIVVLDSGDMVPADLRLIEANRMQADESALTGESVPVNKSTDVLSGDVPLAERSNMVFKGTAITHGSGKGVVASTGMSTELGNISEMAQEAETEALTPLEKRLNRLGQNLVWFTLGIAALVGLTGYLAELNLFIIFKTAVALAVAAIPEGLPIVATIALARGMWRMAEKNALVNKLSSVETLGATSIICADKTGTLTENKMTVKSLTLPASEGTKTIDFDHDPESSFIQNDHIEKDEATKQRIEDILTVGVLCNNAQISKDDQGVGDPMELALLQAGLAAGLKREVLLENNPEEKEVAFSTETKMMATWHRTDQDNYLAAVKGAPEAVTKACTRFLSGESREQDFDESLRKKILEANHDLAGKGLRMLAVARKLNDTLEDDPYYSLTFLGLVAFLDPPREGVKEVIAQLNKAGIRVVMVTGDQHKTAEQVGKALGMAGTDETAVQGTDLQRIDDLGSPERQQILKSSIFARIAPAQKLDLISLFQSDGSVVAMTGDGVNDAPALTKADIGVAMGKRGTQVAKEASDIVLKDDAFSTIALAVEQGRIIFNNIRKFIVFLLSGNVGAILIVGVAMLFGTTLPLLPLQILYLNMISDVFPALALGVGKGDPSVMDVPPRPSSEPVVPRALWGIIAGYGILIALTVLAAFQIALENMSLPSQRAVTISFLTLAFTRTWHVFNMRDFGSNPFLNDVTRNIFVWGAVFLSIALLLLAVYFPPLARVLSMVQPTTDEWGLILGTSLAFFLLVQVLKQFSSFDPLKRKPVSD